MPMTAVRTTETRGAATFGRIRVDLDELIALRLRAQHVKHLRATTARDVASGGHVSRRRGRGMDYLESRVYQPGDDVRHLDWRLTARSGRLHTKLFQEEHDRSLLLLVDTNPSMFFGTRVRFKSVQAARAAALAAWLAARAGERVGIVGFGCERGIQRATDGMRGALAVCGALARWDERRWRSTGPASTEPLELALQRLRPLLASASRILVISDGQSAGEVCAARLRFLRRHASLSLLCVADALELSLPPAGHYPFEHEGRIERVNLGSRRARQDFLHTLNSGPARLQQLGTDLAIPYRSIDTRHDPLEAVSAVLGVR